MDNPFSRRIAHAHEVLTQHIWWMFSVVVFGLGAALFTWRDEVLPDDIKQNWRVLNMLPRWDWGWWVVSVAMPLLVIVLESSYRVRRRMEAEKAAILQTLQQIGLDRPVVFETIGLENITPLHDGSHLLRRITFRFRNTGTKVLRYRIVRSVFQIENVEATAEDPNITRGYISAGEALSYGGDLSSQIIIPSFPFSVRLHLIMEYDNVPPVAIRIFETETLYSFNSIQPIVWTNVILKRDER